MANNGKATRPFDGQALDGILREFALVNVTAGSLKMNLEPLSPEDEAAGAEPLTPQQIQDDLEQIMQIVTRIVLNHLNAAPAEWYAANDAIE